jgi:hypothetical protein
MNKGLPPILSFTNDYDNSDSSDSDSSSSSSSSSSDSESETSKKPKKQVFKSFKNLAIPIHLFSMHEPSKISKRDDEYMEDHGHLPDNIYDELIKLVDFDKKQKRKSKKNYKNKSNNSNKSNKTKKTKTYKNNK